MTLESQLTTNSGALRILANRNYTAPSAFANTGVLQLGGGTFVAPGLTNTAPGEVFGFGTISVRPTSSGTIRSAGGTLTFTNGFQGTGTAQIDAASTLNVSGGGSGSAANPLIHNGTTAGSLNLGSNNLTVATDYTNAGFGVGNTFNPRANVTGAGLIIAAGGVAQQLTGNVTGGTGTTPVMAFGNIHVGDAPTRVYQINNVGASGPSLRGAIQTTVNGGNVTDARLSGTGVTAANFWADRSGRKHRRSRSDLYRHERRRAERTDGPALEQFRQCSRSDAHRHRHGISLRQPQRAHA